MIQRLPAQWQQQLSSPVIQWASVVAVVVIVWALLMSPYQAWRAEQAQTLSQQSARISRMQALLDNQSTIRAQTQAAEQAMHSLKAKMSSARTHSRAISEMVSAFEQIYRRHSLKFAGRRFGDPALAPWLGEVVEVQWRVTGSSDQILNALYDVANNEKLLAPTYIGIKALPKKRRKKQQDYEISMDLRGYRALPMRELKARTEQR